MTNDRVPISVCIPSYNRAHHLPALLDSIFSQDAKEFEIVICEDKSPQRIQIAEIVESYKKKYPGVIRYFENVENLGYDGNIRQLVAKAEGRYCFFMGNDDIMCSGAIRHVLELDQRHKNIGMILKSYAWFDGVPERVNQEVRYFSEERVLHAGREAISVCFRRSGVIAGYIIDRDTANAVATDKYDGTLYYQMYLTSKVLLHKDAVATPRVLVLCRNGEPPDFGNSAKEKGKHQPGSYTVEARLSMISGAIGIIKDLRKDESLDVVDDVMRDYANYFFPFIRDQVRKPPADVLRLYKGYARMGFGRYLFFHLNFAAALLLGAERFDSLTRIVRRRLGRSPHFGLKTS
jgi:abequosyltransferase